jgi:trehalose 6-phosphate phosphatase
MAHPWSHHMPGRRNDPGTMCQVDTATGEAMIEALRADLPRALIALDFDGTIAPIVPHPADSRPVPGAVESLAALARAGAQVAVVTGRDARTVIELGGLDAIPRLVVEGLYGAEQWHDGALHTPAEPESLRRLRDELPRLVARDADDPAVWIEDKRLSLVLHGRLAADPERALDPLRDAVAALGAELGLDVHPGRGVIELRLPGYDKGAALLRLVDQVAPAAVLFIGDDVGDLPAFEAVATLRQRGLPAWSVAAVSTEVPAVADAADIRVAGPQGVAGLLSGLVSG